MSTLKELDPVSGLVDYVLDIKPYHTKIVEVLVEYVREENIEVNILDHYTMDIHLNTTPGYYSTVWSEDLEKYVGVFNHGSLLQEGVGVTYESDTGFDTRGYGENGRLMISSPNVGITFSQYPAINAGSNTVIVNGDWSADIKSGDSIFINSYSQNFTNVYPIYSFNVSDNINDAFFVIEESVAPAHIVPGYLFSVVGAGVNDKSYSVTSVTNDGTFTYIYVQQSIVPSEPMGYLGIETTPGDHTGMFTVDRVEFNGGMIDTFDSYGDNPHTKITLLENLNVIPTLSSTELYQAQIWIEPIVVDTALSYSRAYKVYDPLAPSISQTPNEGTNREPIIGVEVSTVVSGVPIPDSGKIILGGNLGTGHVFVGDSIKIDSSVGNNGTFTITSISYNDSNDETTFGVNELIDGPTADGFATIIIPSNVFFVDGDRTNQFIQGAQFDMVGGTHEQTYTVLYSELSNNKTRVRVHESIFDLGAGNPIVGTLSGFVVPGNQSIKYPAGTQFAVTGSPQNNGTYIVDVGGTTYDDVTGLSTIPVSEPIDSLPGGEVHLSIVGTFKRHAYGLDEYSPVTSVVPETIVAVNMTEKIKFTGLGLSLSDDIIAYNLENNQVGGFDIPLHTMVNSVQPTILSQGTAPIAPEFNDAWFDTNNNILRQWSGYEWKGVKTVWWFDTTENFLYYRTMDAYVDSGWVFDSLRIPGYADQFPAVSETEEIARERYRVEEASWGIAETTFNINTPVPNTDNTLIKVTVDGIPCGITLNNATEFTITSPHITIGSEVEVVIYDRTATRTSAHVAPLELTPHTVLHTAVTVDATNNAYVVSGGNFMDRFVPFNAFLVHNTTQANPLLGKWNTSSFPILDVDDENGTITIAGNYVWAFKSNRILRTFQFGNNYNDFEVESSTYDSLADTTIITTTPYPFADTNVENTSNKQHFYNPPLTGITIDSSTDEIYVKGNVTESFPAGMKVLVRTPTVNPEVWDTNIWEVASAVYVELNDRTEITVVGDILVTDNSGDATIQTPIFQTNSKDMGVIIGAIYDPQAAPPPSNAPPIGYDTGQPMTVVIPNNPIDATATAIEYTWIGPVRFDINVAPATSISSSITDGLFLENEMAGGAIVTEIVKTDATANKFELYLEDSVTLEPINLTDKYPVGSIFRVYGSFSNGIPSSSETNDSFYVVKSVTWDYEPAEYNTTVYPPVLITPATGSGNTVIEIETDFNLIPPYNSFTVVSASNNGTGLSTITLLGDHLNLFASYNNPIFQLDQPLISANPLLNIAVVTNIEIISGDTVLTIDTELIDELYTGSLGMIESIYRNNIFYDMSNTTAPWVHGATNVETSVSSTVAAASIVDELTFGWGNIQRWEIIDVNQGASTVSLYGDFTAIVFPNDIMSIVGSENIDGGYDVVAVSYDVPSNVSSVELNNPALLADPSLININVTITAVNTITQTFTIDGEDGTHVSFLRPGTTFSVLGSLNNDATYTVVSSVYNSANDTIDVTAVEPIPSDSPSGDVRYSKKQAGYFEMDNIDITPWFQYHITEIAPPHTTGSSNIIIDGDVLSNIQDGQELRLIGTESNDGIVSVNIAPTYDIDSNKSKVRVAETLTFGENPIVELIDSTTIKVLGDSAKYLGSGEVSSDNQIANGTFDGPSGWTLTGDFGDIDTTTSGQLHVADTALSSYARNTGGILADYTKDQVISFDITNTTANFGVRVYLMNSTNTNIYSVQGGTYYNKLGTNVITIPAYTVTQNYRISFFRFSGHTGTLDIDNVTLTEDSRDHIRIINTTNNNGEYIVDSTSYDGVHSVINITTPLFNATEHSGDIQYHERGGVIESIRYQGMGIYLEDSIAASIAENTDATLLLTSGSLVDSWDYNYFDVGSFDEETGTVIHLYSSSS